MPHAVFSVVVDEHVGYASSRSVYFRLAAGLNGHPQKHGVPNAQKAPVRDNENGFIITFYYFFEKRQKAVPGIASALSIRKQLVIYCLFLAFSVFTKPLHGFAAAPSEISLP